MSMSAGWDGIGWESSRLRPVPFRYSFAEGDESADEKMSGRGGRRKESI